MKKLKQNIYFFKKAAWPSGNIYDREEGEG